MRRSDDEVPLNDSFNTVKYDIDDAQISNDDISRHSDHSLIKEIDCTISNLETFIVCKEKRIPLFGYPHISYIRNTDGLTKPKFLWNQVAKPILSRNTKRCIFKDLIEDNKCRK